MAVLISSVMSRRSLLVDLPSASACRPNSSGAPIRTVTRCGLGTLAPIGCTRSVPISATGTTGAPVSSAICATPVEPAVGRPGAFGVDAEQFTAFEHAAGRVDGGLGGAAQA
jgi:hypothetical protein